MTDSAWLRRLGNLLAAIWIFAGALVFFVHFSLVFYHANQPAIDAALTRFRDAVPW